MLITVISSSHSKQEAGQPHFLKQIRPHATYVSVLICVWLAPKVVQASISLNAVKQMLVQSLVFQDGAPGHFKSNTRCQISDLLVSGQPPQAPNHASSWHFNTVSKRTDGVRGDTTSWEDWSTTDTFILSGYLTYLQLIKLGDNSEMTWLKVHK